MKLAAGWSVRWRRAWQRLTHSLHARLVLLFLLLALAITLVFGAGVQRIVRAGWEAWAGPLVADYLDRLAADIGSPPDETRARALVARLPITLRISGPVLQYDSHPGREDDETHERHRPGNPAQGALVRSTADGHQLRFGLVRLRDLDRPRRFGWVTLALLLLATAAAYGVVRHLLHPLKQIGEGAARYGRGQFEPPIVVQRQDELGNLAERVNGMARSLHGKLEDKQALLLAISHELRSPLTRARLNAELAPEGRERDALLRDLAEMRALIDSLLEGERIAAGASALRLTVVDLATLVRDTVAALPPDDGPAPALLLDAALPPVAVDATRLQLLLRNLLANARRHAGDATQVPQVLLQRQADGQWLLGVRDFGRQPHDDSTLQRLGQAFYRPDSARTRAAGGVGLGLYLCRLVAQAHGGELRIRRAVPGLEVAMLWTPTPLQ